MREWYKDQNEERERITKLPSLTITYESNTNTDTYGPAKPFDGYAGFGTVIRKHVRIRINNTGGSAAEKCEAKLNMITRNVERTSPSTEPKVLQWVISNIYREDIGAKNFSLLNIAFSLNVNTQNKLAFISTAASLNGPTPPRIEDGFDTGDYDFEVVITAFDGTRVRAVFRLNVTNNWQDLSMQRIE